MPSELYALGDVHDGFGQLSKLLQANGFLEDSSFGVKKIKQKPDGLSVKWDGRPKWVGGDRTLVVPGDLIDKGKQPLETLVLMRELQAQAGDNLVILLGNHEQSFLAGTHWARHRALYQSLEQAGIPISQVVTGEHELGTFLTNLPVMALFDDVIGFTHSGNPGNRTPEQLEDDVRRGVEKSGFGHKVLSARDSIVNDSQWLRGPKAVGPIADVFSNTGVQMMAFGHIPGRIDLPGRVTRKRFGAMEYRTDVGSLVPLDSGMSVGGQALLYRFAKTDAGVTVAATNAKKSTGFEPVAVHSTDVFSDR